MNELRGFIVSNTTESIMILMGSVAFLLLLLIINTVRFSKFKKKYYNLVGDMDNESVETILVENGHKLDEIKLESVKIENDIEKLQTRFSLAVQNVGLIRYNAFGDMGPELSYSIALLDEYLNGVVLTSIHGREQSTSYAKPVVKGKSEYSLSVEEMQAIEKAIKGEFYSNSF